MKSPRFGSVWQLALCSLILSHGLAAASRAADKPAGKENTAAKTPAKSPSERWEKEIRAFEAADKKQPPPEGAVLFTGASGIRMWKSLAEDFPDQKVINRGFGGSEMADAAYFADRIIIPYKPRLIVIQAGGNDINNGKTPEQVLADFQAFVEKVRAKLPDARIAYLSMNPSPSRWAQRDEQQKGNQLVKEYIAAGKNLDYIDFWGAMLGPDGQPRDDLFIQDRLHNNAAGYKIRADVVRPHLKWQLEMSRGFAWLIGAVLIASLACPSSVKCRADGASAAKEAWPAKNDRAAISRLIQDVSRDGIDRRLGPNYSWYHKDERARNTPEVWMPPSKQDHGGRRYQIGGPWTKEGGDFSSTQGQILYVPDNDNFPVDRVTILEWSNGTFSERPEFPWHGGYRPEPSSANWKAATGGKPGMPIAMARGMGSWANCGVIVFASGLIGTAGTVTGNGSDPTFRFPPNKVPTAISITNKNEFALVTICDTEQHKGQVAVLAMESSGKDGHFVHEWPDAYPCLPNVAVYTGIKLLGYIDLPGIEFPTGIAAVGNHEGGRVNGPDGNAGLLRTYDLSKQESRDSFLNGSNSGYVSTAGFAVAVSKYESKAAFIDLQPLFQTARAMYFTTADQFQKTRDLGPEPKQWPWTFDAQPRWKPSVVKVIDVPQPTAVIASMSGGERARAFIASLDGRVGVYSVGGLATEAPAMPGEIVRRGEVHVGRNPTCLAYQKYSSDTILACSRGDCEIDWIKYTDQGAEVIRRLRDARMIDPVSVEMADTHGIETSLITVTDYQGRKIINYRFSRVVFATQGGAVFGMGPDGKDEFECGGVMDFPGFPFCVSAANVN